MKTEKIDGRKNNGGHSPKGAGRKHLPDGEKRVKIAPSIKPETLDMIQEIKTKTGLSIGATIDVAIVQFYNK